MHVCGAGRRAVAMDTETFGATVAGANSKAGKMVGSGHLVVVALVTIGLSVGVSLLVLWVIRRTVPYDRLTPHNEVSGFVYSVIGVIYAVILSFVVISVWEQYSDAETNTRQEADAVGNLYRIAGGLPQPSRQALQQAAIAYAVAVVNKEWRAMDEGTAPSQQAVDQMDTLWSALYTVEPSTATDEQLYAAALKQMDALSGHRQERLEAAESGLLSLM
jgi:hypothetical protein